MTRVICTEVTDDMAEGMNPRPERLYMYAPNCWSANALVAMQFHVEGAAREVAEMCGCHEGDYIWDADTETVIYRFGVDKGKRGSGE